MRLAGIPCADLPCMFPKCLYCMHQVLAYVTRFLRSGSADNLNVRQVTLCLPFLIALEQCTCQRRADVHTYLFVAVRLVVRLDGSAGAISGARITAVMPGFEACEMGSARLCHHLHANSRR